jgi:hypothetical protein
MLCSSLGLRPAAQDRRLDRLFGEFWAATGAEESRARAAAIVESGVSFDEAFRRLKTGRAYEEDVPTGVILSSRDDGGVEFPYSIDVPPTYRPSRKYGVRLQLHGGIGAGEDNRRRNISGIGRLAGGAEQIYILPTSWLDAPWWSAVQLLNLRAILDDVKRTYNIDENRVVLSGVSDGGTAAFYVAMRDTTPFASFLPLIGSPLVLATRNLALPDDLYPNNLLNKPFFVVNGGRDRLYPASSLEPVMRSLQKAGVPLVFRPEPDGEHNTAWWPTVKPDFERFVREHPRRPYPEVLTWQTGVNDAFNRAHWLVINRVAAQPAAPTLPDVNLVPTPQTLHFGVMAAGARVTRVIPGSNAAALGLRAGDAIRWINGRALSPGDDLGQVLERCCRDAARMELEVQRNGEVMTLAGALAAPSLYGKAVPMFPRRKPSGRVDLVKRGNRVIATTSGVAEFTLLLSPDAFDLDRAVTVVTNGTPTVHRVTRSVATMLKWAAVDNDRAMLFGAELRIIVE